jgi:hypothetical protein
VSSQRAKVDRDGKSPTVVNFASICHLYRFDNITVGDLSHRCRIHKPPVISSVLSAIQFGSCARSDVNVPEGNPHAALPVSGNYLVSSH